MLGIMPVNKENALAVNTTTYEWVEKFFCVKTDIITIINKKNIILFNYLSTVPLL
jgi:hypothetical protein